ncbi:H-NS family nucleoid-associated regulatory protein [Burkholderia gladioli]|uniref:H-NS histone family protein n=1 Tax=Burkholderia gladioli TaxID=28095 RepID=UPI001EDD1890|nr:H-NS histone family protein [Burkholderia gladioli]MDD1788187.1 H-NS histone family protein [Burkholderia gladioli]MDJ1164032.1 H-NS histone family protein [Burkholderia gladioli pv. gladioli]MDN7602552.1 H-NS histone family protein [Burkholderia gladioli]
MNRFYRLGILATLHSIPEPSRPANRIQAGQSAMFRLKSYRNRQTMKSYQEYQKSTASLRQELDKIRREHAERVLQELRECIIEFGFRPEQLMPPPCPAKRRAKYYNPASGATWTGRGRPPDWIRDKDFSLYLLPANADGATVSGAVAPEPLGR